MSANLLRTITVCLMDDGRVVLSDTAHGATDEPDSDVVITETRPHQYTGLPNAITCNEWDSFHDAFESLWCDYSATCEREREKYNATR